MIALLSRRRILLAILLLGLAGAWWLWNGRDAVQVPAAFAGLAEAVADGDADQVLAGLHPAYEWERQWPALWERRDELRGVLGAGGDPETAHPRGLARAGLRRLFALHAFNRLELTWRLRGWSRQEDGSVAAVVDLGLRAPQGGPAAIDPPAVNLRVVLRRYGLSPRLRILAHDPLPVRTPGP